MTDKFTWEMDDIEFVEPKEFAEWDEDKHPRRPKGDATGGEFAPGGGGDITGTAEFKKWFSGSKVVDADGKPLVVYHGTQSPKFDVFDPATIGKTMGKKPKDQGFWFVDQISVAQQFTTVNRDKPVGHVIEAFLSMKKPYIWDSTKELQGPAVQNAIKGGYDGVVFPDVWDGMIQQHTQYLVFSPQQIKMKPAKNYAHEYRQQTTYERRVDFKQAEKQLDASEAKVRTRLTAQLKDVQDSTIAWVQTHEFDSNTVRYLAVASLPEFQRTLQDMFEQAWNHGRNAGVKELPRKVKKKPTVQSVKTFAWDYCPCWADHAEWYAMTVHFADWDESKHPRRPKGDESGGEFAPGEGGVETDAALIGKKLKSAGFSNELVYAARIAANYENFQDFKNDWIGKNYHGVFWHLTDDPNFKINPTQGPRDASSLGGGGATEPGLMVTTDIENWLPQLGWGNAKGESVQGRPYAAQIDLSSMVPNKHFRNVGRGFGHEIYVDKPGRAKVVRVLPVNKAIVASNRLYKKAMPQSDEQLQQLWEIGRSAIAAPSKYANAFEPTDAMKAFENRAWMIKDVIDSRLQAAVRQELWQHLQGGRTLGDTIDRLREIFEPYVGDPSKIRPGSNITQAYRLETIIRTEMTYAMNQGRAAVADASDDYVTGFLYSAVLDERTSEICQAADGLLLRKDASSTTKIFPPNHPNCRSLLVFITIDDEPTEWSDESEVNAALELIPKGWK